jgi:hypothetical protein
MSFLSRGHHERHAGGHLKSCLINGVAHGGQRATTVCQLAMRFFKDGDSLTLEPWRARAFPLVRDLIVNRSAFDRIIQAGGFIGAPTGSAPDANAILRFPSGMAVDHGLARGWISMPNWMSSQLIRPTLRRRRSQCGS